MAGRSKVQITFGDDGTRILQRTLTLPCKGDRRAPEDGHGGEEHAPGIGDSSVALYDFVLHARKSRWKTDQAIENSRLQFNSFYEIETTSQFIFQGSFRSIALQFPDFMLPDSPRVVKTLKRFLETMGYSEKFEIFVLGDTAYGSCCVDEVAASHMGADAVVHYGHTCLHPTVSLPVKYVLGHLPMKSGECALKIKDFLERCVKEKCDELSEEHKTPVLILHDIPFAHSMDSLDNELSALARSTTPNLSNYFLFLVARTDLQALPTSAKSSSEEKSKSREIESSLQDHQWTHYCGQTLKNSLYGQKHNEMAKPVKSNWIVIYVGPPGTRFTRVAMRYNRCKFAFINPLNMILSSGQQNILQATALLTKRYFLVERIRESSIIGVLVGTMAVGRFRDALQRVKNLIRAANKKCYFFMVGKINPAKILNFPEIDVFVLVACPENSLLDSKKLFKPLVTPFELELALCEERTWDGSYSADFRDILDLSSTSASSDGVIQPLSSITIEDAEIAVGNVKDDHAKATEMTIESNDNLVMNQKDQLSLAKISATHGKEIVVAKNASEYMQLKRSFQGLEQRLGQDAPAAAIPGMRGLAWTYEGEGGAKPEDDAPATKTSSTSADASVCCSLEDAAVAEDNREVKDARAVVFTREDSEGDTDTDDDCPVPQAFALFDDLSSVSSEGESENENH